MSAEELLRRFNERYGGFVVIGEGVVADFINLGVGYDLDLLLDYVLSQDLAEEIVL